MAVSMQGKPGGQDDRAREVREGLRRRIAETVGLLDRRGYGLPLEEFAALLYGGPEPAEVIESLLPSTPGVELVDGLVVRNDRAAQSGGMKRRQASHIGHAPFAVSLSDDFVGRMVGSCPLVRAVTLTGSATSGGFDPRDDVDLNIFARNGTKYTVYLWALALSALTSLRNRKKVTDEMGAFPFLPKIICINVVWEESQVRPFSRQDKWLAYELLVHKAIVGAGFLRDVNDSNRWLGEHFPQFFEPGFVRDDSEAAIRLANVPRAGRRFFERLDRHPGLVAFVEAACRFAVIGLHRVVSLSRARKPEARAREAFVNTVKRPYSVYDVPGRAAPVPNEALEDRDSAGAAPT